MRKIDRVAEAIMVFEGMKPGSVSYRYSNPGNLRWSATAERIEDGYAQFATFSDGWNALVYDLKSKCNGKTKTGLTPQSTVLDLFHKYAPPSDNNDPAAYAAFVAKRAGIKVTDTLASLLEE